MADYYLNKTAARIDQLLDKVETLENYDDSEIKVMLDGKVDKETGKGLSTNDFTNAYKTAVDGAAPQSTTYTKTEVDTDLAEKADLSILTPMTQAEYDAIVTKTAPLYFIYEDGGGT